MERSGLADISEISREGLHRALPESAATHGVDAHEQEAVAFFGTFPDQHLINNAYKIMLAQGEWKSTVAAASWATNPKMRSPFAQRSKDSSSSRYCRRLSWQG